jgi:hypothetical protein
MSACLNFTLYLGRRPFPWWHDDFGRFSKLCHEFAGPHFSIDIIQIGEEQQRAFRDGVITTPAMLVELPGGRKQHIGGLSETEKFLRGLELNVPQKDALDQKQGTLQPLFV